MDQSGERRKRGKGNAQLTVGSQPISQSGYFWSLHHVHQAFAAVRLAGFVSLPGHIAWHDWHESALFVADEGRIVLAEVLAAETRLRQVLRVEQRLGRLVWVEVAVPGLVVQLRHVLRRVTLTVAVQVIAATMTIVGLAAGQVIPRLDRLHLMVWIAPSHRRLGRVLARALQAAGLIPVEGVGADGCCVRGRAAVSESRMVGW